MHAHASHPSVYYDWSSERALYAEFSLSSHPCPNRLRLLILFVIFLAADRILIIVYLCKPKSSWIMRRRLVLGIQLRRSTSTRCPWWPINTGLYGCDIFVKTSRALSNWTLSIAKITTNCKFFIQMLYCVSCGRTFNFFFFETHDWEVILNVQLNTFSAFGRSVLIHGKYLLRLTFPTQYVISRFDHSCQSYCEVRCVRLRWPTLYIFIYVSASPSSYVYKRSKGNNKMFGTYLPSLELVVRTQTIASMKEHLQPTASKDPDLRQCMLLMWLHRSYRDDSIHVVDNCIEGFSRWSQSRYFSSIFSLTFRSHFVCESLKLFEYSLSPLITIHNRGICSRFDLIYWLLKINFELIIRLDWIQLQIEFFSQLKATTIR